MIPLSFAGKKVIITGAGSGLGRLLASRISEQGGIVYAISRTKSRLDELKAEHPKINTISVDLANYDDARKTMELIEPVDMLVNNAAINIPGYMMKISKDDFQKTMSANVLSPLVITQIVTEKMISKKINGSIVNISSIAEKTTTSRQGMYGVTKASLSMMSKIFAFELGPKNIRVNTISPGLFPSNMSKKALDNPKSHLVKDAIEVAALRRIGTPDEIANAVLFLLHESSSYITGQSLFVCGGTII